MLNLLKLEKVEKTPYFNKSRAATPWNTRLTTSKSVLTKYNKLPVLVDRTDDKQPEINANKFLIPHDMTVGQFLKNTIRKRINLSEAEAVFLYICKYSYDDQDNEKIEYSIPPNAALLSNIYHENQDRDGYLYLTYSKENTFG